MGRRKKPGPKRRPRIELLKMTTMRLPPDMLQAYSRRASRLGLKRSELVRIVLADYAAKSEEDMKQVVKNALEADDGIFA